MAIRFLTIFILLCSAQTLFAEWIDCPPLRNSGIPGHLGDIENRMPPGHIYRDSDKITWGHETTHGINARLRNQYARPRGNAFYVLGNRAALIQEPPTTLTRVADAVPGYMRGRIYDLYLVNSRQWWDGEPLYMVDEWVAYCNGSAVGMQLGQYDRAVDSLQNAFELAGYVAVMWDNVKGLDGYEDAKFLGEFIHKNYWFRCHLIYRQMKEKGLDVSGIESRIKNIERYRKEKDNDV